jgi:predicted dehydrogenase
MELVGSGGLARMDAFRQNLTIYTHEAQRPQWAFWGSDADLGMIAEFIAAIREKRPPLVTGVDGLRATEIALAAYRSAQSGQPEKV